MTQASVGAHLVHVGVDVLGDVDLLQHRQQRTAHVAVEEVVVEDVRQTAHLLDLTLPEERTETMHNANLQ